MMQRSAANFKTILPECKCRKKDLCLAGMDYQKTFDRVPHSWIMKHLELIGINNKVISITKKVMSYWRTRMRLHTENKLIETDGINNKVQNFKQTHCQHCYFALA